MKNKIPLVSPSERANFENNKKLFIAERDKAFAYLATEHRPSLTTIFDGMFGGHGSHRRDYSPKTNAWRSALRHKMAARNEFEDVTRG